MMNDDIRLKPLFLTAHKRFKNTLWNHHHYAWEIKHKGRNDICFWVI